MEVPQCGTGGAPVRGLGDKVSQKLKHIVVYCNKFNGIFEQFYAY